MKTCLKAAIWEVPSGLEDAPEITFSFSAPILVFFADGKSITYYSAQTPWEALGQKALGLDHVFGLCSM